MTALEASIYIKNKIEECLLKAGLVNGKTETPGVPFFETRTKSKLEVETYLVFDVISQDVIGKADNKIKFRDAYVMLNIYSRLNLREKKVEELLFKIETEFLKNKWEFEIKKTDYDETLKLSFISVDISKKIKKEE